MSCRVWARGAVRASSFARSRVLRFAAPAPYACSRRLFYRTFSDSSSILETDLDVLREHRTKGLALKKKSKLADSTKHWDAIITQLEPLYEREELSDPDAKQLLAEAYTYKGMCVNEDEAMALFDEALRVCPAYKFAQSQRAQLFFERDSY